MDILYYFCITSLHTGMSNTQHITKFYVVKTVHFGMKLYNNQRNARVFNFT
jgi:hypothetical protein